VSGSANSKPNRFFMKQDSVKSIFTLNSFGLLRLLLATVVVFQHSLVLTGFASMTFIGFLGDIDLGTIGVSGFFAVSGFLLFGSSRRLTSRSFVIRRFFRLFPGLLACLVVCGFVIVPIANRLSVYESSFGLFGSENSSVSYLIKNSALVVFQDSVGSVYGQNIYPSAVNGSLWTLAPEFVCYMGLLVVAIASRKNLSIQFGLITVALLSFAAIWIGTRSHENEVYSQVVNPASGLAIAFCTGSLLAILIEVKPIRPKLLPTLVGLGLWIFIGANGPLSLFALSVLVVFLGISLTKERFASVGREVDVSYGLYLYHFPIIQTVLVSSTFVWSSTLSYTLLPVLALVISGSIAYTSWRFVEKPSIDRARANTISN
jgi:peptidoglycan/LPS O-acetylase OafA/YrhL